MTWTPKMGWRVAVLAIPMALAFAAFAHAQQTTEDSSSRLREIMDRAERVASIEANKATFVGELLGRFSDEAAARGYNAFLSKGTRKLMARSGEDLLRLSQQATDFDTFRKLVFEGFSMNTFGQLTQELVFFPMAACRLYDSRAATTVGLVGPMTPGTQRDISVNDTFGQGGTSPDCGTTVPDLNVDPPALALVITAANPSGPGNLRTFASGAAVPNAAALTYTAGVTISTGTITDSCTSCGTELTIRNQGGGNTDVVVDIVGYFHAPFLQAVDCTTVTQGSGAIAAGALNNTTATCPAGYTVTGGGHFVSSALTPAVYTFNSSPSGNGWTEGVVNTQGGSITTTAYARCCRVPGR